MNDQLKFKKVLYRAAMKREGSRKKKEFVFSALVVKFYNIDVTNVYASVRLKPISLNIKFQMMVYPMLNLSTY